MKVYQQIEKITKYLSVGILRIFSPSDDAYPVTGVQPYQEIPRKKKRHFDW